MRVVVPLIIVLLRGYNADFTQITCQEALKPFDKYECLSLDDKNYLHNLFEENAYFTVKIKESSEYRTLRVKDTIKSQEKESPEIMFLKLTQGIDKIVKMHEFRIEEKYTYIITDQLPELSVNDIDKHPDCLKGHKNILKFVDKVLQTVIHLEMIDIVNATLTGHTIKVTEECEPLITDFSSAAYMNARLMPHSLVEIREPLLVKGFMAKKYIRYTDKIDVWKIAELLYFLTHSHLPFTLDAIVSALEDDARLEFHVSSGIPIEIAHILEQSLVKEISRRAPMTTLSHLIQSSLSLEKFILLEKPMTMNQILLYPLYHNNYMTMFSELVFVMFLAFLAIPVGVCIINYKIKADEQIQNINEGAHNEELEA